MRDTPHVAVNTGLPERNGNRASFPRHARTTETARSQPA